MQDTKVDKSNVLDPRHWPNVILMGLTALKRPGEVYQGTADPKKVAINRRRNKAARRARRVSRK